MRGRRTARFLATIAIAATLAAASGGAAAPAIAAEAEGGPHVDSVSTSVGAPGSEVVLRGSGFGAARASSFALFNGVRAETVSWTDTEAKVRVPKKAAPGYVGVVVNNVTSNGLWFAATARPRLTNLSTSMAPIGSKVTITGTGLGYTQGAGRVVFGTTVATVLSWTNERITVLVPNIRTPQWVGVWQAGAPSNGLRFTPYMRPQIDTLSKRRVKAGDTITVSGINFGSFTQGRSALTVAGNPVTTTSWTPSTVTFTVPHDMESGYVGVWRGELCGNGVWVDMGSRIDSLYCADSKSTWWGAPGSEFTITGSGFGTKLGRVSMGGANCPIVSWTNESIVARVPAEGTEGYVGVWRGPTASNGLWFLSLRRAQVSSAVPNKVAPAGILHITGSNFGDSQGSSVVKLDGVALEIADWSDSLITAMVPNGATSGYLGVWKRSVASNGVYVTVTEQ
ncbi:MAG: IPT/TIG domain-containing protein [Coriobacteriales bacterium]|nr:IPT/TIG domain-containing protein [Coriobacteriales bacterium]